MSTSSIRKLNKLVNDYISAQAARDAEKARLDAERAKRDEERMARLDAERANRDEERMARLNEERAKRDEERMAKLNEERARLDAEIKKDYEKRMKRLERDMGKLGNSYGDQVEAMFVNLGSKFNAQGFSFPKEAKGSITFLDENRKVLAEVDHLLENGSVVLPIEVKARLKQEHVDDHIRRLGVISAYNIKHNDNRKVLGAVAGGIVPENVLAYAQKRGLYVLVQNGESVEIANPPANFTPKEW